MKIRISGNSWALAILVILWISPAIPFAEKAIAAESIKLEVLDPRGEILPPKLMPISARLNTLAMKKIGILNNTKGGADAFQPYMERALKKLVPAVEFRKWVIPYNTYPEKEKDLQEIAKWNDGVVGLLGD